MSEVKVNEHGTNVLIEAHIGSDERMREIGFTDYCKDRWYYTTMLDKKAEISFNVTILKDNPKDICIDILDEDFCQPYDYQAMLERHPDNKMATKIKELVEAQMMFLQDAGVLSGHVYGAYI